MTEAGKSGAETVELDQSRVGRLSRMDAMQGQAMSQAVQRRRMIEINKINAALQRIDAAEYGYCLSCDEAIAEGRLAIDPAAPLCVACADKTA
jgi:DnaK suppressor protein